MGFASEKGGIIPLREPLKPIYTTTLDALGDDEPTTPTSEGSRIPNKLPCPPPPRKRKPSPIGGNKMSRCKSKSNNSSNNKLYNGKTRDFFVTPPDLEAVFIRRHNVGC